VFCCVARCHVVAIVVHTVAFTIVSSFCGVPLSIRCLTRSFATRTAPFIYLPPVLLLPRSLRVALCTARVPFAFTLCVLRCVLRRAFTGERCDRYRSLDRFRLLMRHVRAVSHVFTLQLLLRSVAFIVYARSHHLRAFCCWCVQFRALPCRYAAYVCHLPLQISQFYRRYAGLHDRFTAVTFRVCTSFVAFIRCGLPLRLRSIVYRYGSYVHRTTTAHVTCALYHAVVHRVTIPRFAHVCVTACVYVCEFVDCAFCLSFNFACTALRLSIHTRRYLRVTLPRCDRFALPPPTCLPLHVDWCVAFALLRAFAVIPLRVVPVTHAAASLSFTTRSRFCRTHCAAQIGVPFAIVLPSDFAVRSATTTPYAFAYARLIRRVLRTVFCSSAAAL